MRECNAVAFAGGEDALRLLGGIRDGRDERLSRTEPLAREGVGALRET